MPRLTPRSFADVCRRLEALGCERAGQKGSHVKYRRGGRTTVIPRHGRRDIPVGVLADILKQLGLSRDQFLDA